ncbi:acyl carrier protein [Paenibacillus sp. KACC 21273]|uniref:acyl carrier protein n=1 Tax=Paenibacillus sp. KACC 21273 TaxID=3025665 RepID=UPI002366F29F|nr:acyl carrier protein [Paenibacillus sp. KACC 21273]WDF52839.1 acyl carrier protein [Paenibacillus sp. KACC 21273]
MNNSKNIASNIQNWIKEQITYDGNISLDQDLSHIGLDSFSFVKLIVIIENHYSIEIDDDSLIMENISTIESLVRIIEEKNH